MEHVPHWLLYLSLALMLAASGFFAMSETAMMASNRYRLRALAQQNHRGARLALALLGQTDKLLGVILLFNTLINSAIAVLAGLITVHLFGEDKWALGIGTLAISFMILVFAEITPKVVGAAYPDKLTLGVAYALNPILKITNPVISVINIFVHGMLRALRLKSAQETEAALSPEELRSLVLESTHAVPRQHREILVNLFDLEHVTVEDVMKPRGEMEAIDLAAPIDDLLAQLATAFHTRLPVFDGDPDNIVGILHQRRLLAKALGGELTHEALREELVDPYFIPPDTPIFSQLQFFKDNRQRIGLVVDEYGEIQGLVTLEDIVEEIVGKFTTSMPGSVARFAWDADGSALVDGTHGLREINRILGLSLPLDGPKTLNGLILEHLQDIPEVGVGLRIAGVAMEIVQTEDRRVKIVRLHRPEELEG